MTQDEVLILIVIVALPAARRQRALL